MPYQVSFLKAHRNTALPLPSGAGSNSAEAECQDVFPKIPALCSLPLLHSALFPYGGLSTKCTFPRPLLCHRPLLRLSAKTAVLCAAGLGLSLPQGDAAAASSCHSPIDRISRRGGQSTSSPLACAQQKDLKCGGNFAWLLRVVPLSSGKRGMRQRNWGGLGTEREERA